MIAACFIPNLNMRINGVSMIIGLGTLLMYVGQCGNNSSKMLWQTFHLTQSQTDT
jgi:hypothetical protein